MTAIPPVPEGVEHFLDSRGGARAMRVSWHREAGVFVLSTWRGNECVASFRLDAEDAGRLVEMLQESTESLGHASQI
jgi:hypothetical protein